MALAEAKREKMPKGPHHIEVVIEHHYPNFVKKHRFDNMPDAVAHYAKHAKVNTAAMERKEEDEGGE